MSRHLDMSPRGTHITIVFPYDRSVLDVVRALPQRRFDPNDKSWSVPNDHIEEVIGCLHALSFELSDSVLDYCQTKDISVETIIGRAAKTHQVAIDVENMPAGTWTVASLNEETRSVLHGAFREAVWIAAEIQGFDRNKSRGHAFFELVHRPFMRADPTARVAAVMWRDTREAIEEVLHADGASVRLRDGLIVRVLVKVDFYTGQGRYQVAVQDIDLAYTDGTQQQNRERLLRHLEAEGIAELNLLRPWPRVPMRIGLITSDESDAYADFVHELSQSGYGFQVDIHHAQVQGSNTESSVLRALKYFAAHANRYDALAIVRGGGSRSDLAYFDTERIGRAVCEHPLKVVVGIGHQRDVCLLDFIAYSEKTPTAAAQFFVDRARTFIEVLDAHQAHLSDLVDVQLVQQHAALQSVGQRVQSRAQLVLQHNTRALERATYRVHTAATARLDAATRALDHFHSSIPSSARAQLQLARVRAGIHAARLSAERLARSSTRARAQLDAVHARLARVSARATLDATRALTQEATRLNLLDPRRILERGFALVRQRGQLVRHAHAVDPHQPIDIQLAHDTLRATPLMENPDEP